MNVRGGAATLYYPVWHYEVETLLVLKNNKGTQDNRARNLDYAVQLNKHFYTKATSTDKEKRKYNLFSPSDVPGLYEAFFRDQVEFEQLYDKYSADESIRRRTVDAFELFSKICTERNFTGRIYIHNVDNTNTNSPFDTSELPIYMSNLCVSGETEVLVMEGSTPTNRKIKHLNKKWVKVFNGKEFTEAFVNQTAPIVKMYHVLFEYQDTNGNVYKRDGANYIRATKDHVWYVKTDDGFKKTSTVALKAGDEMEHCYIDENNQVQIGKAIVQDVIDYNVEEASYCLNEVLEHKAVFNGVLAGQCTEIALPTKDLESPFDEEEGEIALCTLSAINVYDYVDEAGNIDYKGLQLAVEYSVRSLDNLLDYQEYPFKQAKNATHARRPLGISITNLAAFLAKQKLRYESNNALVAVDKLMEAISFFAIRTSVDLAKELGPCSGYKETLWSKGILPFHRANKNARALVGSRVLTFDDNNSVTEHFGTWEELRQEMKEYGIRNSTLLTQAPTETSSQVINSTNGIEPPRMLVTSKISKDGKMKQVVPDIKKYGQYYTTLWSLSSNVDTINISAVMQTWVCQAISTNTNYDPVRFEGGVVQIKQIMSDILYAYKMGLKTLYYQNTRDHQKEKVELEIDSATENDDACASGACAI